MRIRKAQEKSFNKIKKMRQTGLDREGEYSYENISFKVLRRTMYLDKLSEIEDERTVSVPAPEFSVTTSEELLLLVGNRNDNSGSS